MQGEEAAGKIEFTRHDLQRRKGACADWMSGELDEAGGNLQHLRGSAHAWMG
jgi:hypothetical protein